VHRWPQDSPEWDDSTKKQLDDSINKNPEKKQITIKEKTIQIENFEFTSLQNIGISVPFFKEESLSYLNPNLANFLPMFTSPSNLKIMWMSLVN